MAHDVAKGLQVVGNPADLEIAYYTVATTDEVWIGDLLIEDAGVSGVVDIYTTGGTAYTAGVSLGHAVGVGTTIEVPVCIDPRAKYQIQVSTDQDIAATDVFSFFSVIMAADPSSDQDFSNMELDVQAAGATDPLVVLGIAKGPAPNGGSYATFGAAHAQAIVKIRPTRMITAGAEA